jgi:hypothetical protein
MADGVIVLRALSAMLGVLGEWVLLAICASCHMPRDGFYGGALFLNALIIGWGLPILLRGDHGA